MAKIDIIENHQRVKILFQCLLGIHLANVPDGKLINAIKLFDKLKKSIEYRFGNKPALDLIGLIESQKHTPNSKMLSFFRK